MPCIHVSINGRTELWPLSEYLDYKAGQYGFDSYDELVDNGYSIRVSEDDILYV